MNHVFHSMGTAISVQCSDAAVAEVTAIFQVLDLRFSLYRDDSEASRLARGDLHLMDASQEMRDLYALAHTWRQATDGAFRPHRPDGVIDLAGVVKAEAIRRSGEALARHEGPWLINAGGDVLTSGQHTVGIVNPHHRRHLLSQYATTPEMPAVATSGVTERGQHIWRAGTVEEFIQVSVAAPDIMTADVLATAIMAGGRVTLDNALASYPIQALAVRHDATLMATSAFRQAAGIAA